MGLQYVIGDFLFPAIPFNVARMVHTNLLIVAAVRLHGRGLLHDPEENRDRAVFAKAGDAMFWVFLVAGAATILGYLLVPYATLAQMTGNDIPETMGRSSSSSRCSPRSASWRVALVFLFNPHHDHAQGPQDLHRLVLMMGLGLAVFFPVLLHNPHNLVLDKYFWWWV